MEEEFHPTKLIVLSELSTREKEKYYQLLLLNQARFVRDKHGRYIANIRLLAPGIRKNEVLLTNDQKRKKDNHSNYALVFQERLTKLRQNGFINVNITGVHRNNFEFNYHTYPRFVALIAYDQETVKPKLRPLSWVMKHIEDIYDSRFVHEKHDVEREEDMSSFDLILLIFPIYVVRRLGTNVGLKSLVDQTCWDLLYSVDYYRNDYLECELFGRFIQEFYDHNDLLFYLYVRSVIAKVLHINFKNRWTTKFDGPGRQPQSVWMSYREASHITGIIFGKDNKEMIRDFMSMITPQMVGTLNETTDSRRIDITEYLHLSVVGYHQSQSKANQAKQGGGGGGERYLIPLPGQVAPVELVPDLPSHQKNNLNSNFQSTSRDYEEADDEEEEERELDLEEDIDRIMRASSNPVPRGLRNSQQMPKGQVLGAASLHSKDNSQHNNINIAGAAEAYDLEEEERGYQAEYKAARSNNQDKVFQQVNSLPLGDHYNQPFSPIGNDSMINNDGNHGNTNFEPNINQSISYDNIPFDQSQGNAMDLLPNAFEQLQMDREQEFMTQLCFALSEAPQDIYDYVSSTLRDRLHQTVK
jgi:hypothetical protein